MKEAHVLVPPEHPRHLVGHQVHHLDAQHGAVDEEVAALVENGVLPIQGIGRLARFRAKKK